MTDPAIEALEVVRRHGSVTALRGLSLSVPRGARLGVVGPNGAGKTTLMRLLSSTLVPSEGSLRVLGHDTRREPRAAKAGIGVVPQGMTLDTELRVGENLAVFARYHGLSGRAARRQVGDGLAAVGLADDRDRAVAELSGGMQRRLLIARALLADPALVLLDEPTTGLDPESRTVVWEYLLNRNARGATLVVTTHHLDEVEELCDELLFLDKGVAKNVVRVAELRSRLPLAVGTGPETVGRRGRRELSTIEDAVWLTWQAHRGLADASIIRPDPLCTVRLGQPRPASPGSPGPAPGRPSRRPSVRQAGRVWIRNFTLFKRSYRTTIVPNFFEPVFLLLALGLGLGPFVHIEGNDGGFTHFLAPGLLSVSAMNGAVFEVTYNIFVRLRHARSYDAVVTTPVEPEDIALGELAWALTRSFIYSSVFLSTLAVLGLAGSPAAVLAPLLLLPLGLVFACIGMLFTGVARVINAYSYFYALFMTPLMLVSGVFFPTATSGPGAVVQQANPLHHGVEITRALMGGHGPAAVLPHFAWLLLLGLVLVPFALLSLRRHLVS